jgi:ParB family transcriptional regulator, chromosome partitioning protein
MTDMRPIASIVVGTRHRRDLGDIDGLARSLAEVGLLHPIIITRDGMLDRRRAPDLVQIRPASRFQRIPVNTFARIPARSDLQRLLALECDGGGR